MSKLTNKIQPSDVLVVPRNNNIYKRKQESCKDWLLDAIYFICPDCSCVQCSAIFLGLTTISCLIILFLYLGNYWETR